VVVTWFHATQPGFLDFSYRIRALSKAFALTVVSRAPLTQDELLVPGVGYFVIGTKDSSKRSLVLYVLRVARYLRRSRPDVVVHLGSHTAAAVLLTSGWNSAVYWNEHPAHYLSRWPWWTNPIKASVNMVLRHWTYRGAANARLTMPIGEAHYSDLVAHGASPNRLRLLYMGVDSGFRAGAGKPVDTMSALRPLDLVYTGTVAAARGRDVMLEGLALANRDHVRARLKIIGASAEQISYCRARGRELGIEGQLEIMPRVSGHLIPALIAQADIGVCIWEDRLHWRFNPPTKLFEYLVAGLPVLASNIRTHTQYITNWENGCIFEYSPSSFSERIVELWSRRSELPLLKRNAATSSEKYLWERIEPDFIRAVSGITLSRAAEG
jgi:glycosyltransferase involved in cell wall biosynthesis